MNFAITYTSAVQLVYLGATPYAVAGATCARDWYWFCLEGSTAAALKRGELPFEVGRRDAKG